MEDEVHIADFLEELQQTTFTVQNVYSGESHCSVEPFIIADWPAMVALMQGVAPAGATTGNANICPWCTFTVVDKLQLWTHGPWRRWPFLTAEEFMVLCCPLLHLDIHHYIYGPMHGWAHTVSHMLITFVKYIMAEHDWAHVHACCFA